LERQIYAITKIDQEWTRELQKVSELDVSTVHTPKLEGFEIQLQKLK